MPRLQPPATLPPSTGSNRKWGLLPSEPRSVVSESVTESQGLAQVLLPGPRDLLLIYLLFSLEYHVLDGVASSSLKCFPAYKPMSQSEADRKHKTLGLQGWSQRKQHAPVHMFGVRCPLQTVGCPTGEEPRVSGDAGFP